MSIRLRLLVLGNQFFSKKLLVSPVNEVERSEMLTVIDQVLDYSD